MNENNNNNYLDDIKLSTPGKLINATVVSVSKDVVIVDTKLKSESWIPIAELDEADLQKINHEGSIDVYLLSLDDGNGKTLVSREKARIIENMQKLEEVYQSKSVIPAKIVFQTKWGYTVLINNVIKAFLPISLVGRERELVPDQIIEVMIAKINDEKDKIIVSRKGAIEKQSPEIRSQVIANINKGDVITGIIKNITSFGAFVDLGQIDGLIHIGDMSWERINHPSQVVTLGQQVSVKVLEKENDRISLGLKHTRPNPWDSLAKEVKEGDIIEGVIKSIVNYGFFVEVRPGIEGLVHKSQISWDKRQINIIQEYREGETVQAKVIEINPESYKISLSLKDCYTNPWNDFIEKYSTGDIVECTINSIKEGIGIFVNLDNGLSALIKEYDLTWKNTQEELKKYSIGQKISARIINCDNVRKRISLGIKQLNMDYIAAFAEKYRINSIVTCTVLNIDENQCIITPDNHIEGLIKTKDIKSVYPTLAIGDNVEVMVLDITSDKVIFKTKTQKPIAESIGSLIKEKIKI